MKQTKRERHRVKRAARRKHARSQPAHGPNRLSAAERLNDALDEAQTAMSLLEHDMPQRAVVRAARAVHLAPDSEEIAHIYARAADASKDSGHLLNAYEHLLHFVEPDAAFLIRLAFLHTQAKNHERAAKLAEQARLRLPGVMKKKRQWVMALDLVEQRCAAAAATGTKVRKDTAFRNHEKITAGHAAAAGTNARKDSGHDRAQTAAPGRDVAAVVSPVAELPTFTVPIVIADAVDGMDVLERSDLADPIHADLALLAAYIRQTESFDRLLSVERAVGLEPLSYQQETVRRVLSALRGRALLADEVGLGKTVEAGLVLSEYLQRGHVRAALVLTPPSLVGQWREELSAKFGIEARTTADAAFRSDSETFWSEPGVIVASLATARSARNQDAVAGRAWDIVVIDEAHTLKNARSKAYELTARLRSRFLLLLTATPVENDVEELYNLVSLIRPGHLGGRAEFVRRFGRDGRRVADGAQRMVRELLAEVMVRNTRALSGVKLPPRFARTVLVEPEEPERELYGHLVCALRALGSSGRAHNLISLLLQEAGSSPFAVRATLEKVRAGTDLEPEAAAALAPAIAFAGEAHRTAKARALVAALGGRAEPALVFTRFRATLDFLAASLEREGIAHERLDGRMPAVARHEAIERCRRSSSVLLSTDVGSEGLNLQFCRRLVNFDLPWSPMRIEQRIGRLHRIGQEREVEVVNLCLAGSIEERILEILDERINLFELVVGEVETILGYLDTESSFSDLMLRAFAERDEHERDASFRRIGDALAHARDRYRSVKAFDESLFRNELGV